MLPLQGYLFIPSLIVTPVVLLTLFVLRQRSSHYYEYWRAAVIVCIVLCTVFLYQVLSLPLYSEKDKAPDNPGGFSVGMFAILGMLFFETCVVIPAFPVLVGASFLAPREWDVRKRAMTVAGACAYVMILAWLIAAKNENAAIDYKQAKEAERSQVDQFQHKRRP